MSSRPVDPGVISEAGKLAVDADITQFQVANVLNHIGFGNTFEIAVHQAHIFYGSTLESPEIKGVLGLPGGEVPDLHVAHHGHKFSSFAFLIKIVDGKARHGYLSDFDVSDVYVFQQASAHSVVLDPDRAVQARTVHPA